MALVKMYRNEASAENLEQIESLREKFMEIYQKHDVDIMGHWQDQKNPNISYYMARYENEDEYKKTVEKLKEDEKYRELTDELNDLRSKIEITSLTPL